MNGIRALGDLLDHYKREKGIDATRGGHCFIVTADGAAFFMREIFGQPPLREVEIRQEEDTLFHYKNVPVRLRFNSAPGQCYIFKNVDVPARSCCDLASVASVMAALTRGQA